MQSTTGVSVEDSYRLCESIARGSNFYNGFRLLPPQKHRALSAIYAFMRQCDDIADTDASLTEKKEKFGLWRTAFERAMQGDFSSHPTLPALRDAIEKYQIPPELFQKLIDGTEMDLVASRYATFEDLYQYCYHVASVVGLICIRLFGYQEDGARKRAEECGIAFQLTNILRDIKEDFQKDRIYLPQEDLRRFEYTEEDLANEIEDERFFALMKFEAERAKTYYEKARTLVTLIDRDSRPAFWAMFLSYRLILRHIEQRKFPVFRERVKLNQPDKVGILLKSLVKMVG